MRFHMSYYGIALQIGKSFVISKLKDYPQFFSVAIAIKKSGFKVCIIYCSLLYILLILRY